MSLGVALGNAGRLTREMERRSEAAVDTTVGSIIWSHALAANGSIVSTAFRVTPLGVLRQVERESA